MEDVCPIGTYFGIFFLQTTLRIVCDFERNLIQFPFSAVMQRHNRRESSHSYPVSRRILSFSLIPAGRQICYHMTLLRLVLLRPCSEILKIAGKLSIFLMLCYYSYWQDPAGPIFSCMFLVTPTNLSLLQPVHFYHIFSPDFV